MFYPLLKNNCTFLYIYPTGFASASHRTVIVLSAAETPNQCIFIALFQMLSITWTVFPISEKEQSVMLHLAWANPGVQKLKGNSNGASKKLGQFASHSPPCHVQWWGSVGRLGGISRIWMELSGEWVTWAVRGETAKRTELFSGKWNSTSMAQLQQLSHHAYPLLQMLESLKPMKKKETEAHNCWLALQSLLTLSSQKI